MSDRAGQPMQALRIEALEWGAVELARRIARGEVSAREAVELHIRRIEEVNPRLNAVVVPLFTQARKDADRLDAQRARGTSLGALHGVPVTIKECFDVANTPTTAGIPGRAAHRAAADSPLVRRLREAGAVVLGKTNVPEMLLYIETDNPLYGRTSNPWSADRAPNGSSGGEAAIVATGGSTLGLGTDLGGSIRLPAHACGIHGLKPTSGRLSLAGTFDELQFPGHEVIRDAPGPLARRVEDLAAALRVLAAPGQEEFDASIPPVPLRDHREVAIERLRVGYYEDDGFFTPAPALRRAVREAADALRRRGVTVQGFAPPDVRRAMRLYFGLLGADGAAWAPPLLGPGRHDRRIRDLVRLAAMPRAVRPLLSAGLRAFGQRRLAESVHIMGPCSARAYWQRVAAFRRYRAEFLAELDAAEIDAWICPPSAHPALTHGASYELTSVASYTMLYNLLGLPAGVVAATRVRPGEESDRRRSRDRVERRAWEVEQGSVGLPVGVQVVARYWREDVVLAVMEALETQFRTRPDYPRGTPNKR